MTINKPEKGWDIQRVTTHPGVIFRDDFLEPIGISAHCLAIKIRVPATRVTEIIHERRSVTSETALCLSHFFGTSAEFWMNLQAAYDLSLVRVRIGDAIRREVQPLELEAVRA